MYGISFCTEMYFWLEWMSPNLFILLLSSITLFVCDCVACWLEFVTRFVMWLGRDLIADWNGSRDFDIYIAYHAAYKIRTFFISCQSWLMIDFFRINSFWNILYRIIRALPAGSIPVVLIVVSVLCSTNRMIRYWLTSFEFFGFHDDGFVSFQRRASLLVQSMYMFTTHHKHSLS